MPLFRHLVRTAFVNAHRAGIVQAYAVLSAESVTDDHPGREFFEKRYRTLRSEVAHAFEVVCAERGVTEPATVGLGLRQHPRRHGRPAGAVAPRP